MDPINISLDKNFPFLKGHEYALDNLEFVCHIDPDNSEAQVRDIISRDKQNL